MVSHYREITPILIDADEAECMHELNSLLNEVKSNTFYYKDYQYKYAVERITNLKNSLESLKYIREFINSNPN